MKLSKEMMTGILCGLLVTCIWSGWTVFSRLGIKSSINVYDITALRFTIAGLIMLPVFIKEGFMGLSLKQVLVIVIGTGAPYSFIAVGGLHFAPASHAALFINGTLPVFTMLMGYLWLKERSKLSQIQGAFFIVIGCLVIAWEGFHNALEGQWIGHSLFIFASLVLSVYLIASRYWGITGKQAVTIGPVITLFIYTPIWFFFVDTRLDEIPINELIFHGIYQGIIVSLGALWLFTKAANLLGPTTTAVFMAAVPAVSLLLSIPVLNEYPTTMNIVGLLITTLGILFASGIALFWLRQLKLKLSSSAVG